MLKGAQTNKSNNKKLLFTRKRKSVGGGFSLMCDESFTVSGHDFDTFSGIVQTHQSIRTYCHRYIYHVIKSSLGNKCL